MPDLKTFAVEPAKSPVISGGEGGPHKLQGIGAGFVPTNLHTDTLDGTIQVSEEDAFGYVQRAARTEGMLTDPVYEGKSLAGLIGMIRSGEIVEGSTVLYCHLGGQPALPAYAGAPGLGR